VVIPTPIIPQPELPVWALLNLILTILTGFIMIAMLVTYFGKKRRGEEESDYELEDEKEKIKRRGILRLASIIPTLVAVILFILTEDMRRMMVFTDRWTIWMAVIAIVQVILALLSIKRRKGREEEGEAGTVNA